MLRQLVGNDVVDLDDPAIARSHLHERFVARVCTDEERAALAAAVDPKTLLWCFFAAKEAAYKVAAKVGPAPGFAHRAFAVAPDLSSVRIGELFLHLRVSVDAPSGRVHAIAKRSAPAAPHTVLAGVEVTPTDADAGTAARRALRGVVARQLGCAIDALEVVRPEVRGSWDGYGPPRLLREGAPLPGLDVSLSHDGRFIAFAASMPVYPSPQPLSLQERGSL